MSEDYRAERKIDKFALDDECIAQHSLYIKYARQCAEAKKEKDKAEDKLEREKGKLDLKIRKDPEAYGLDEDPKEKAIAHTILQGKEIRRLQDEFIDAKREAHVAVGREKGFEQRKIMLRVLGELWIREYYMDDDVRIARTAEVRDKIAERRRRRGLV